MATPPNTGSSEEARIMNDSTMPPPARQKVREKHAPRKGFGLSDWVRLSKSAKDLAQRGDSGPRRITRDEIKKHDSVHDGWIVLQGKVYNITPYLHYHPGGVSILKGCLGKDGSKLFDKYHPWVNIDGLIGNLLLGYVDDSGTRKDDDDTRSYLPPQVQPKDGFAIPAPRPPKVVAPMLPKDEEADEPDGIDPLGKSTLL